MKTLEQEAQEIFEVHPKLKVVYMTSDGVGYESEHNALQRAKQLDGKVTVFTRQEPSNKVEEPSNEAEEPSNEEQEPSNEAEKPKKKK